MAPSPRFARIVYATGGIYGLLVMLPQYGMAGRDPARYRALVPITVIEKLGFGLPVLLLYARHRVSGAVIGFGILDLVWAALFAVSYVVTSPGHAHAAGTAA